MVLNPETTASTTIAAATETATTTSHEQNPTTSANTEKIWLSSNIDFNINLGYAAARIITDYLASMCPVEGEKGQFILALRESYKSDPEVAGICSEFLPNYSSDKPMLWIWRHRCFSSVLSTAFGQAELGSLMFCGFLLRDLVKQFEQHKCTSAVDLYLGKILSNTTVQDLRNHQGQHALFSSFFTATSNREKASASADPTKATGEEKPVLFIIRADPTIKDAQPFAKASSLAHQNDENDAFVFMMGSIFKIDRIEDGRNGVIDVHMSLTAFADNTHVQCYHALKPAKIVGDRHDLIGLMQLSAQLGQYIDDIRMMNTASSFIESLIPHLSVDHPDRMVCWDLLGRIEYHWKNWDSSIKWYEQSISMREKLAQSNDLDLLQSYEEISQTFQAKGDFTQARIYFEKAFKGFRQMLVDAYPGSHLHCARLAFLYESENNLQEAIYYYYQALAAFTKQDEKEPAFSASLYHNLGKLNQQMGELHLALGFYQSSLEAKRQIHPEVHPSLALAYTHLGALYQKMNESEKARENFSKAFAIYEKCQPQDVENMTKIQKILETLSAAIEEEFSTPEWECVSAE